MNNKDKRKSNNDNMNGKRNILSNAIDAEMESQRLAQKLKMICHERGVGMSYLSEKTGISRSTLHNLFQGKSSPYVHTLLRICDVLEIDIRDLFDSHCNSGRGHPKDRYSEQELIEIIKQMSEDRRRLVFLFIDMVMQYRGTISEKGIQKSLEDLM